MFKENRNKLESQSEEQVRLLEQTVKLLSKSRRILLKKISFYSMAIKNLILKGVQLKLNLQENLMI